MSAYSLVRNLWQAASGNQEYPEREVIVRTFVTRIRLTNPAALETFFADDGMGRAVFSLRDLDDETLQEFIRIAADVSDSSGIELSPVGTAFVMKEMNDQIIPQQVWSLILAAALVGLLLALLP